MDNNLINKVKEAIDKSVGFILKNQNGDGGWGPDEGSESDGWSTGEVLYTLKKIGKIPIAYFRDGINWLLSNQNKDGSWWSITFGRCDKKGNKIGDTPSTSCAIIGLRESESKYSSKEINISIQRGIKWLLDRQRGLKGWTLQPDIMRGGPHIYSTAYAMRALCCTGKTSPIGVHLSQAASCIIGRQKKDGGWGYHKNLLSDPTYTCYALHGLFDVKDRWGMIIDKTKIIKAIEWLKDNQQNNGFWSDWLGIKESTEATSYAIYILLRSNEHPDSSSITKALRSLLNVMDEKGGWRREHTKVDSPRSIWVTHNALMALSLYLKRIAEIEKAYSQLKLIKTSKTNVKVRLGISNQMEAVIWQPLKEPNPHLVIVGGSGFGKSETIKLIVEELKHANIPCLIIDFMNEYGDVAEEELDVARGLSINPLELCGLSPRQKCYEVSGILRETYKLGRVQEDLLRDAIKRAYKEKGIIDSDISSWKNAAPNLKDVYRILTTRERDRLVTSRMLASLRPLFDLNLFSGTTTVAFGKLIAHTVAIQLQNLPNDQIKATTAEVFLRRFWYHVQKQKILPSRAKLLRRVCIVDEAHRLTYKKSPLNTMVEEARKYGLGMIVASQLPEHITQSVIGNSAAFLTFGYHNMIQCQYVARVIGCKPYEIMALRSPGDAIVKFSSDKRTIRLKVISRYENLLS